MASVPIRTRFTNHAPRITKASNNAAKGWEEVTAEGITKHGYQAVIDKLKQIKKGTGDDNALGHYKSLRGQGKRDFAWKLNGDKSEPSWLPQNIMARMYPSLPQ